MTTVDLAAARAFIDTHARILDRHRYALLTGEGDRDRTSPDAAGPCDWLGSITLDDGGLPFVAPMSTTAGVAPWFGAGDPSVSSLQITAPYPLRRAGTRRGRRRWGDAASA